MQTTATGASYVSLSKTLKKKLKVKQALEYEKCHIDDDGKSDMKWYEMMVVVQMTVICQGVLGKYQERLGLWYLRSWKMLILGNSLVRSSD